MLSNRLVPNGVGARVDFPGFQEILDFTATGSESSVSVMVDGDTGKEYIAVARTLATGNILLRMNGDATAGNYGYQYLFNNGTISAARATITYMGVADPLSLTTWNIMTPAGFIKTATVITSTHTSGTTMNYIDIRGVVFNSTANITSLDFVSTGGAWTSGTRITVYVRRL